MNLSQKKPAGRMVRAWSRHERRWRDNRYVYAVVSRRSKGVSIGINLNPGKECNFDCIYCQVDRKTPPEIRRVNLEQLAGELDLILNAERDGSLYSEDPFNILSETERGIRDIAFSGDGEPTTFPRFEDAVRIAAAARSNFGLVSAKLVLITDAAYLKKPRVSSALRLLDQNNGEIWAKLDAGTEEYFLRVNRPNVPLKTILDNILDAARARPVVIQSLWLRIEGTAPPAEEVEAYCARLNGVIASGGKIKAIQLYTIARNPAEPSASPLSNQELDQIAFTVKSSIPAPVETFYAS